jgi:hypothetical protein
LADRLGEAATRYIAEPEHEKMHDERLWDPRQKRDREMLLHTVIISYSFFPG